MWMIKDVVNMSVGNDYKVELIVDSFQPNAGFTYEGRTVKIRMPKGTEIAARVEEMRQHFHLGTCGFVVRVSPMLTPPGSFMRFLNHGVEIE